MAGIDSDPENALASWNSSGVLVCNWTGVKCDAAKNRVVQLDLSRRCLGGTISPVLSNLSSLAVLDLSHNFFRGRIPAELGSLFQLRQLCLPWNLLQGNIPHQLGFLQKVEFLDLGNNKLVGEIPTPLFCNCSSMEYVDLSNNSLSGEIPFKRECTFARLKYLLLWSNQLVGNIPRALSNASNLQWLDLELNRLTGELPAEIVRELPQLQFLYMSHNEFEAQDGSTSLELFFSSLVNSSNLQEIVVAGSNLAGELPPVIGNLSRKLVQINLAENFIYGSIPPSISNLANLSLLNLTSNGLNGSIPVELSQMGKLERVYLSRNSFSGKIPVALGDTPHLGLLDLSKNKLSGSIPDNLSNLSQLRRLFLNENQLSGTIPLTLGKCTNLEVLDLSQNRISGEIPREVGGLSLKLFLNLSANLLHGSIPLELSKLDMVLALDLSSNNLSGQIPTQLGSCIALEYLNLSGNSLEGPLPDSIGKMSYLRVLDLSSNRLNGNIPSSLQSSLSLKRLNFSFNSLSGNISNNGSFSSLTMDSFLGNCGLCGPIKGMPNCPKNQSYRFLSWPVLLSLAGSSILCIIVYPLLLKSRMKGPVSIFSGRELLEEDEEQDKRDHHYPKISYQQLVEATDGFKSSSLIGSGQFGHVYKGVLRDNTRVAVKVLHSKMAEEASGSFKRECRVLKQTKHRNLIRIITICSKPDFKALVLPLMPKGSLERHLYPSHGSSCGLTLVDLVKICSGVADAMAYLHHHCPVRVVHCDLKPSNILLDDDMTALVTDFGIARLVKGSDEKISVEDSTTVRSTDDLLCGSVGYIAPEYGLGKGASTQGDVYSFGVLLLEIITGMRPTDILFQQGSSLHEWVKSHYPDRLEPITEDALARPTPPVSSGYYSSKVLRNMILEIVELGLMCTQYSPSMRPTMSDVAQEMGQLKQYLADPSTLQQHREETFPKEVSEP